MTDSTLERMLAIFDVEPLDSDGSRFAGDSDSGGRQVVEGSQILAQSLVAASKALPGRAVRSFASAVVTVSQGGRTCATSTVLLDHPQPDLIRHDRPDGPPAAGPDAAYPVDMPMRGRKLRIEGVHDLGSPDEAGPPIMDAWLRYDTVPDRDDLRRALLAYFTGHLSISTSMRPHPGIGTSQAHHTISTAVMGIGISFHDPVQWDGWIRYHHESTYAGAGMCYVRGQVLTEDGRLIASFTQDAMIRAFEPAGSATSVPVEARL